MDVNTKPTRSWMKYLLIVSLGLNLLVAGLAVGSYFAPHHHKSGFHGGMGMRMLVGSLPDEKRSQLRDHFKENRSTKRANGKTIQRSMDDILQAIAAQPFDAIALQAAFDAQKEQSKSIAKDAQNTFVAIISAMSNDERRAYVKNLKERGERYRKRRKKQEN